MIERIDLAEFASRFKAWIDKSQRAERDVVVFIGHEYLRVRTQGGKRADKHLSLCKSPFDQEAVS